MIYEDREDPPYPRVTESEFKRRIDLAFRAAFCTLTETFDYDKAVDIILHGDGKEAEPDEQTGPKETDFARGFRKGVESVQRKNPSGCCCKFDEAGEIVIEPCTAHRRWKSKPEQSKVHDVEEFYKEEPDDEPSPAPTREEWEKWAELFAETLWGPTRDGAFKALKTVILSMPIVPKE